MLYTIFGYRIDLSSHSRFDRGLKIDWSHKPGRRLRFFASLGWGETSYHFMIYDTRLEAGTHICPRRKAQGREGWLSGQDYWQIVGPDRVCTYCGSMHPEDFQQVVRQTIEDDTTRLEKARGKTYKWYIRRKDIRNAGDGAIKFYEWHVPSEEWKERVNRIMPSAMDASQQKFAAHLQEVREKMGGLPEDR